MSDTPVPTTIEPQRDPQSVRKEASSIKSDMVKGIAVAVGSAVITGIAMALVGLPAINARMISQVEVAISTADRAEKQSSEAKSVLADAMSQVTSAKAELNTTKQALERLSEDFRAQSALLHDLNIRVQTLRTASPMELECANIMRQIGSPSAGLTIMSWDEEKGRTVDSRSVELHDRFDQLGCQSIMSAR